MISYQQAKQMKELGLTQKRHDHARYYINETAIAYFEDIKNAFDTDEWHKTRGETPVQWQDQFCYIPELVDLIGTVSYNLTLDAAVYHFVEGKKSHLEENIGRSEGKLAQPDQPVLGEDVVPLQNKPIEPLVKTETTAAVDRTLVDIENYKRIINETQIKP